MPNDRVVIRALWGVFDTSHPIKGRRFRIENNMAAMLANKFAMDCTVYVYGEENIQSLEKIGCKNYRVVSKEPFAWDIIKYQYRHKMEIIKLAFQDGAKEILYMDWDCIPYRHVPSDFWESMSRRSYLQANLAMYNKKKAYWRRDARRQVPNGGFLYLNDAKFVDKAIQCWEARPQDNDEPAWGEAIDSVEGGWKGQDYWWNKYEAMHCNLHNKIALDPELIKTKEVSFIHYHGRGR